MSLIGISGKLGSGKDTVGDIIRLLTRNIKGDTFSTESWKIEDVINTHGWNPNHDSRVYNWEVKKFADKLKNIVCLILGCTREELEDQDFKSKELGAEWDKFELIDNHPELHEKLYFATDKEARFYANKKGKVNWYSGRFVITKIKMTPRLMLQLIGTEGGRDLIHPNIWINSLFADYKPFGAPYNHLGDALEDVKNGLINYPNWLITDMRFPNEMEAVKSRGGVTIRVNRIVYEKVPCNNCQGGGCPTCNGYGYWEQPVNSSAYAHPSETSLDDATFDYVIDNNGTIEELIEKVKEILVKENII